MELKTLLTKDAEYLAQIVALSYSTAFLKILAAKMGAPIESDKTIYQALLLAGKATDFNHAVSLVVAHLDGAAGEAASEDHRFNKSKIERRKVSRNT